FAATVLDPWPLVCGSVASALWQAFSPNASVAHDLSAVDYGVECRQHLLELKRRVIRLKK
ncbi:MAG TPA: hypothetical protein VIP05_28605, partial [Burkholderiaceae bacterium]